jgi:hypothetical protein
MLAHFKGFVPSPKLKGSITQMAYIYIYICKRLLQHGLTHIYIYIYIRLDTDVMFKLAETVLLVFCQKKH